MAYIPNFTWTVADVDRVKELARRQISAAGIAERLGRSLYDVVKLCDENGIFIRNHSPFPKTRRKA